MLTIGQLIELALGKDEARHVDTAIPQNVFDVQNAFERQNNAGWYYQRDSATGRSIFGRLLTKGECWAIILDKLKNGKLGAYMGGDEDHNIAPVAVGWACLRNHVEAGEIVLKEETE